MKEYRDKLFQSLRDWGDILAIGELRFVGCDFTNCSLSATTDIERRTVVRNLEIVRCVANSCHIGPAIFEDIRVEGLETNQLLIAWGALFKHVTLSGKIGELKVNQRIGSTNDVTPVIQARFDAFRKSYYHSVDWALDISGARFRDEFEFRGIPARLIRRDPDSQAVVKRERVLAAGDWREQVNSPNDLWPFAIDLFLSDGDEDMVLVVPLGARKRKRDELLRSLRELRELGVVEPD